MFTRAFFRFPSQYISMCAPVTERQVTDNWCAPGQRPGGRARCLHHTRGSSNSLWTPPPVNLRPKSHSQVTPKERSWGQRGSVTGALDNHKGGGVCGQAPARCTAACPASVSWGGGGVSVSVLLTGKRVFLLPGWGWLGSVSWDGGCWADWLQSPERSGLLSCEGRGLKCQVTDLTPGGRRWVPLRPRERPLPHDMEQCWVGLLGLP